MLVFDTSVLIDLEHELAEGKVGSVRVFVDDNRIPLGQFTMVFEAACDMAADICDLQR